MHLPHHGRSANAEFDATTLRCVPDVFMRYGEAVAFIETVDHMK